MPGVNKPFQGAKPRPSPNSEGIHLQAQHCDYRPQKNSYSGGLPGLTLSLIRFASFRPASLSHTLPPRAISLQAVNRHTYSPKPRELSKKQVHACGELRKWQPRNEASRKEALVAASHELSVFCYARWFPTPFQFQNSLKPRVGSLPTRSDICVSRKFLFGSQTHPTLSVQA